jgi:tetratricopeptide (TPR) repeat protein
MNERQSFFFDLVIFFRWKALYLPIWLLFIIINCTREKELSRLGFEKEQKGSIAEAIYDYQRALDSNPNYGFANKRMGFLLSESQFSIIPAISHLENALQSDPEDIEILIKLIDLYSMIGNYTKAKSLLIKKGEKIPAESMLFLESTRKCLESETPKEKEKAIEKLDTLDVPPDAHLYYRSVALCYEKGGRTASAENFVTQYRRKY